MTRFWVVAFYVAAGAVGAGVSLALGRSPFETRAWLGTTGLVAMILSAGLGVLVGATTVAATRVLVRRTRWVRALHDDLRPVVRGADDGTLLVLALASGVGEELLFRGLLTPLIGVVASSIAFGLLHQVRGRARWGWMAWAVVMGAVFALVLELTGSLLGAIVAHVYINGCNLRFLRDNDLAPRSTRSLGGLLDRGAAKRDPGGRY